MVLVNKADETLTIGERSFDLGCNQYPGTLHPTGFRYLRDFNLSPLPTWTYQVPGATLRKTLWMPHGTNATVVRYELIEGQSATLSAHPFVTGRDYHGTHRYNTEFNAFAEHDVDATGCHVAMRPYADCPDIVLSHEGEWYPAGAWYYSFEYAIEQERGLDFVEDAYCPGAWVWQLNRDNAIATWVIGVEAHDPTAMLATYEQEVARLQSLQEQALVEKTSTGASDNFAARLTLAADQFVVQRQDGLHTVLAGYPWFLDWGRDTMIALPGLCLATRRFDVARSILLALRAPLRRA
jgi:predicted glycogen debranching enzyme